MLVSTRLNGFTPLWRSPPEDLRPPSLAPEGVYPFLCGDSCWRTGVFMTMAAWIRAAVAEVVPFYTLTALAR